MALYIVSLPIGHPDDITLRAINVLKKADFLICEELKNGRRLLKKLEIVKKLYNINEHNEADDTEDIIKLLKQGKNAALFSDCGTPLFADPGTYLVSRCHESKIKVIPVPGASSLLSALAIAGTNIKQFYFAGFLSRKSEERQKEIKSFEHYQCPVIIYDTPYRLNALLNDIDIATSKDRNIKLFVSLTQPDEKILFGTVKSILNDLKKNPFKKEFVLLLEPQLVKNRSMPSKQQRPRKKRYY